MSHIRSPSGAVLFWHLGTLEAEAFGSNDPDALAAASRGVVLVAESLRRARTSDELPAVGAHDPHRGHHVAEDPDGVLVCFTCSESPDPEIR
jgi:hypothetical protein